MNVTIDCLGKPLVKARPRWNKKTGAVYTPSARDETVLAMQMLPHKGAFAGMKNLSVLCWFFGADPRADADNLVKAVWDCLVKAGVIDDDRHIVYGSFELRDTDAEGNPFPGEPSTKIRVGIWK